MRRTRLPSLCFFCISLGCAAQAPLPIAAPVPASPGQAKPAETLPAQTAATLAPTVEEALGVRPLLEQLHRLRSRPAGQPSSGEDAITALTLRQAILEHVLAASFEVDSVLGRIDTEASYSDEDRYVLETHAQRQATLYNLVTFAASGALGAAGGAMQLTHGLNHAGTALSAAGGSTALLLSAAQLRSGGGKRAIRSPYNMLAEVLDQKPNAESSYPPLVLAYLRAPRPGSGTSIAEGLTTAWRRLQRLQAGSKSNGITLAAATADRSSDLKLSADDLADREAMLHDLRANIALLHSDLQAVLLSITLPQPPDQP